MRPRRGRWPRAGGLAGAVLVACAVLVSCGGTADEQSAQTAAGTATAVAWPDPAGQAVSTATARALQQELADWVTIHDAPGVTAAVVSAEHSWAGAVGVDGAGTSLQPESAGAIASVTKTFVAAEVMLLAERGVVDLDAPVTDYLGLPFDARGATVRQLLGMRAGFPPFPAAELLPPLVADLRRVWTAEEVLDLVDTSAGRVGEVGGEPAYDHNPYIVLGQLVEEVTGDPLATAVRRDLLTPAGLTRVWVQPAERPVAPLARAAAPEGLPVVDLDGPYLPSAALASALSGSDSVAADSPSLAQWGYALYGGRAVGSAAVAEMTAPGAWYGLGTVIEGELGTGAVGHLGDDEISMAVLAAWPETRTAVAVLVPGAVDGGAAQLAWLARQLYALTSDDDAPSG